MTLTLTLGVVGTLNLGVVYDIDIDTGVIGTLNLGVAYDGADLSERLRAGPLHLEV